MSRLACLAKGKMNRGNDRVDSFALSTPIMMVDAIALVMALEQSRAHEVRDCPAHIGPPGMQQPRTNLIGHDLLCSRMIGRQGPIALEVAPNLSDHRTPSAIAMRHRQQGPAQPVPDRNCAAIVLNIRTGTRGTTSRARDQVEYHEGVTRPGRHPRQPFQDGRQVEMFVIGRYARQQPKSMIKNT